MIRGVGTDLVAVPRIAAALARHGERFPARVLTPEELLVFAGQATPAGPVSPAAVRWLAKRWAAKEAAAKAFGTGIGAELSFQDLVVGRDAGGRPLLLLRGRAVALAREQGVARTHLSLSDEREFALAFVVLEG